MGCLNELERFYRESCKHFDEIFKGLFGGLQGDLEGILSHPE